MLIDDYARGVDTLYYSAPAFASLALALGKPVENTSIATAQVSFYNDERGVFFEINPAFLADLTDEQVAAVIAHETYHILFSHLTEIGDRVAFPDAAILTDAQECIINDGLLPTVGVELGPGFKEGVQLYGADFSSFSSREAYDFIAAMKPAPEEQPEASTPEEGEAGDAAPEDGTSSPADAPASPGAGEPSPASPADEPAAKEAAAGTPAGGTPATEEASDAAPQGCGGMHVEGTTKQFQDAVLDAIHKMMHEVDDDVVPDSLKDTIEEFAEEAGDDLGGGFSRGRATAESFTAPAPGANLDLNWRELLALINPRIKQAGTRKRYKDTWSTPNRRMITSYPRVILPAKTPLEGKKGKGDSLPAVIIALDLSGSIPARLIGDLVQMLTSIPDDVIQPHAVTWSNSILPFDPATKRIVPRSGTNIDLVYTYAQEFKKREGYDPYVLVITDGECSFSRSVDETLVQDKWFWMGIDKRDTSTIRRNFSKTLKPGANVYTRSDFSF